MSPHHAPHRPGRLAPLACALALLALGARDARAGHPVIRAVAADISEAEATTTVEDLVAFMTRYSGTPGCDAAGTYLFDRLTALGYTPAMEPFAWGAETLWNVTARHVGVVAPDELYLLVAHYDSTSDTPMTFAPGADDDASGVAIVLEAARALAAHRFEATVEIVFTSGEEQGLLGSLAHANAAQAASANIAGVINHDMVGYWPTGWGRDLDVNGNFRSQRIVDAYVLAAATYVPGMPVDPQLDWGVCDDDQWSYDQAGFPALIVMDCREAHLGLEGETTPHYHQTTDTIDTLDLPRMTDVGRATAATAALLARPLRRLLRDDGLLEPSYAGTQLRPGLFAGGEDTAIDLSLAFTTVTEVPVGPYVDSGAGELAGPGAHGAVVFYESDRPETLRLQRTDQDADSQLDIVVTF